jgi:hypothetical protein
MPDGDHFDPRKPSEELLPVVLWDKHALGPRFPGSIHFGDDPPYALDLAVDGHFPGHSHRIVHRFAGNS